MNKNFLNLKSRNLPVYVYRLHADIALVHSGMAYKIRGYYFTYITVVANQPLRPGDVVGSCYYGNENIEIIPHLCKKSELGGAESELKYYYGCRIDRLMISAVTEESFSSSCGEGHCTVFIELSASALSERVRSLDDRYNELTNPEKKALESLREEWNASSELDYWKKRIPDWDKRLECIGEVPADLMY